MPGWRNAVLLDETSPAQVRFHKIHEEAGAVDSRGRIYRIGGEGYRVVGPDTSIVFFDSITGKPALIMERNVTKGCVYGPAVRRELAEAIGRIVAQRKGTRVCICIMT